LEEFLRLKIENSQIVSQPYNQAQQAIERHQEIVATRKWQREKVIMTELMLKAYYDKLYDLATYNRQKQLQAAQAEQGRIIDIEVK
tara:strand:+ start:62 stop:319 length:258 start_codon:yes stop_codon:yes gene_type:complete